MLPKVRKVIQLVDSSFTGELTIEDIARSVNLSPSRISRLFKSETGTTIGRFIKHSRLERARNLLETTDLSVVQILTQTGISCPSHFVRDFKKVYGVSPSQYRNRCRSARQEQRE